MLTPIGLKWTKPLCTLVATMNMEQIEGLIYNYFNWPWVDLPSSTSHEDMQLGVKQYALQDSLLKINQIS